MVKLMKLSGKLRLNMNKSVTFMSSLYDGTPFECDVDVHDYEQNEEFEPGKYFVDGWLYVVQESQQDSRCYLTLPKPNITYGKQVLVRDLQLMPRSMKIEEFNPKKIGGKAPVGKIVDESESQAALAQMVAEDNA